MARSPPAWLIFGGFLGVLGAAFYPIYFRPAGRVEEYSECYGLYPRRWTGRNRQ